MEEPLKDVWGQVADGFTSLGQAMKDRYRGDEEQAPPAAEADAARDAFREAIERLVSAGREVGQRAVETLRDDDVRTQAKQAATTLNDALSATVDLIGREVGGLFKPRADVSHETTAGGPGDEAPPGTDVIDATSEEDAAVQVADRPDDAGGIAPV